MSLYRIKRADGMYMSSNGKEFSEDGQIYTEEGVKARLDSYFRKKTRRYFKWDSGKQVPLALSRKRSAWDPKKDLPSDTILKRLFGLTVVELEIKEKNSVCAIEKLSNHEKDNFFALVDPNKIVKLRNG